MTAEVEGAGSVMKFHGSGAVQVGKVTGNFRPNPAESRQAIGKGHGAACRLRTRMRLMPTILRHGRWRAFFYSNEGSEPAHVHVESGGGTAKLWLSPVALVGSSRLKPSELREVERLVRLNRKLLLEAWDDFFGR